MKLLRYIVSIVACLWLTSSCQTENDGNASPAGLEADLADCYINFAVAVDNGHAPTRDNLPAGGENGNGREAGYERENAIAGITLILYKDAAGINTSANPTLDLVRYFPVTLGERTAQGTTSDGKQAEAYYTTGQQPLGRHRLDLTATYHAVVVANAPEVAATLTEGTSTLSDLRDKTLTAVYTGQPTMSADLCSNFVMSSEADNTINFGGITATNLDGTTHTKGQDKYYDLTSQPVAIERLAARIDFWAENSNGYSEAHSEKGYEYDVAGTTDKFVVTAVVPFNLTNQHATYGSEYLIKRLRTDIASEATTRYLADETTATYVIDPQTIGGKGSSATPGLTNPLAEVYSQTQAATLETSAYCHTIAGMHVSGSTSTISGKENVVVAYPMENCLQPDSKPYYHATGVAIVGYYYFGGSATGTRYVYLNYLRHQGESEAYDITPSTVPVGTDEAMGAAPAMKYGVVRNNIYRISIRSVSPEGKVQFQVDVHDWREVSHPVIYI